mmetsp:Transcript_88897/g.287890  ORF Transcript_88897/g.287890 Transcript_88897/m.287890 type:complete len:219 (+) Transcript_88897:305-961(+)
MNARSARGVGGSSSSRRRSATGASRSSAARAGPRPRSRGGSRSSGSWRGSGLSRNWRRSVVWRATQRRGASNTRNGTGSSPMRGSDLPLLSNSPRRPGTRRLATPRARTSSSMAPGVPARRPQRGQLHGSRHGHRCPRRPSLAARPRQPPGRLSAQKSARCCGSCRACVAAPGSRKRQRSRTCCSGGTPTRILAAWRRPHGFSSLCSGSASSYWASED